jgi:hypothetical protein
MTNQTTIFPAGTPNGTEVLPEPAIAGAERDFTAVQDDTAAVNDSARGKLEDAMTPGFQAEFDPAEAEAAGAFQESALSEADAIDSTHD